MWHSTQFHHLQFLDMHFAQWDEDKCAELSETSPMLLHLHHN